MANKFGLQTQSGTPPDFHLLDFSRIAAWLAYGNALNLGMAADVRRRNPNTLILLRAPASDWYVEPGWTQEFAQECVRLLAPFVNAGLCDAVLSPNEPVVKNADEAKWLNECQVIFSRHIHANLNTPVVAYNFSVGNPDYPLVEYLRDGARESDYIGLHCYGYSYPDYRMATQAEHYALRYRRFMQLLDVPRRVILTETGIDTRDGGYKSPRAFESGIRIGNFIDDLKWQQARANEDDYLAACVVFGAGMEGNLIKWKSFDVLDDPEHHETFRAFIGGLEPVTTKITPGVPIIPPPPPPPDPEPPTMTAEQERMNRAWQSIGVPFNPDAALYKAAAALRLGKPEGPEYSYTNAAGVRKVGQGYNAAFAECTEGDWANVVGYDWLTGKPYVAGTLPPPEPPPPGGVPPFVFPDVFRVAGFIGEELDPVPGNPFYRLAPQGAVRLGVSAFCEVVVISKTGTPAIGVQVLSVRHDGKGEIIVTGGDGKARFNFGSGSAFTPPAYPPFDIFIASNARKDEDTKIVTYDLALSDVVAVGDPHGQHAEIYMQFVGA